MALLSPLDDVRSNAELAQEHVKSLKEPGGLVHQGKDLYEEIKTVSSLFITQAGSLSHMNNKFFPHEVELDTSICVCVFACGVCVCLFVA